MKKKALFILAISSLMALAGCGGTASSSTSSSASSTSPSSSSASSSSSSSSKTSSSSSSSSSKTSSSSSSSSKKDSVVLAAPVITVKEDKTGLTWATVEHATSYKVKVNDGEYAAATEYLFSSTVATYSVSVVAVGDGTDYADSLAATYNYETKAISLSDITVSGMGASWMGVGLVSSAFSSTGTFKDEDWAANASSAFTATASGQLGVVVSSAYDNTQKINYVGEKIAKYVWIIKAATEDKVLVDNTTDVVDDLTSKYYASTGWEDAGAHSVLTVKKADIEESDKVIDFKIQQLGTAYKYGLAVSGLDSYKGFGAYVKGDGKSSFVIQMTGEKGYASYNAGVISSNWNYVYVPFADSGWTVNGTATTLQEFAVTSGFGSAAATLYAFNEFDIVFKTISDSSYKFTDVYLKNVALVATGDEAKSTTESYDVAGSYTGSNADGVNFSLKTSATGLALASLNLETNINADLTVEKDGTTITLKTADSGASLTYVGKVTDKGRHIDFVSASGTYATYFQQVSFNYVYSVDDFESYTETGVGYDKNNAITAKSGLRANYYSDYYADSGSDELSGSGWSLMGSADYMTLDTTSPHSGTKAMKVKVGNAMRYSTYALSDGTALAWPKGDTLSFFLKNTGALDLSLKVRAYTDAKVNSTNVANGGTTVFIAASTDYTQYTIPLDSTLNYYGFSFTFEHTSTYASVYPLIDDIEVYAGANPHSVYKDSSVIANGTIMKGSTTALSEVALTFGKNPTVSASVTPSGGTAQELTGTYAVDKFNQITITCGDSLTYVGTLSTDLTCIKYVSATGTYGTYAANLFLQNEVEGKTRVTGFENMSEGSFQSMITVDNDANNSGTWTKPTVSSYVSLDTTSPDTGFASAAFAIPTTSAKIGKYRFRWAAATSLGKFTNVSFRCKNTSSLKLTVYLWACTTAGTSESGRVQTGVNQVLSAGSDWTYVTAGLSGAASKDIYGFSFFVSTATASSTDVVTGTFYVDELLVW